MAVAALKAGASDLIEKPASAAELLASVRLAIRKGEDLHPRSDQRQAAQKRFSGLTVREREVLSHVIAGRLNKVIADRLGTSEQTIKVHRGRLMEKLEAGSVADLVRLAQQLGIAPAD
jgi:FixJ family two-component response regulator